jgi:hypothetical protein
MLGDQRITLVEAVMNSSRGRSRNERPTFLTESRLHDPYNASNGPALQFSSAHSRSANRILLVGPGASCLGRLDVSQRIYEETTRISGNHPVDNIYYVE